MASEPTAVTYELIAEINRAAAEMGSPAERIRRLAEVFATPRTAFASRPNSEALALELEQLTNSLQYLVLSVPKTLSRNNERIFVAVLNPNIELPRPPSEFRRPPKGRDVSEVYFFGQGLANDERCAALADRWELEWVRYAKVTYDLQARGIYTWNQYLLHGCRFPRAVGLSWGRSTSRRYITLTPELATALGVPAPNVGVQSWVNELVDLPTVPVDSDLPEADVLTEHWQSMEPHSNVQLQDTIRFGIHHLLRSYAIWGGDGFISLPILLGTGPDSRSTAALSLCARPNLSDREVLRWHAIANACFASVTAAELLAQRAADDLRAALDVYGTVAHETNSLIEKHFKNVPSLIATDMINEPSRVFVQYAWDTVSAAAKVGYFFAKARVSTPDQRESLKARFIEPLCSLYEDDRLLQAITEVAARVYKLEGSLYGRARIPDLEAVPVSSTDVPDWLDSLRFAHCYILCAEPIRNLVQYGDGTEARWSVQSGPDGLSIRLVHNVLSGSMDLPRSATFEALGGFLAFYGPRSGASVEWEKKNQSVRWVVKVDPSILVRPGKVAS